MDLHQIFYKSGCEINGYVKERQKNKDDFHSEGRKLLKALAVRLGLRTVKISSKKWGIADAGELILHSNHLYMELHVMNTVEAEICLRYRTCKGRDDCAWGGTNHYFKVSKLADENQVELFISHCKDLIANK